MSNDQGDNKTMTVLIRIFDTTLQTVTRHEPIGLTGP